MPRPAVRLQRPRHCQRRGPPAGREAGGRRPQGRGLCRDGVQRPQPARGRFGGQAVACGGGDRRTRLRPWRRLGPAGRALAARRLRLLAVLSGDHRKLPQASPVRRAPGAAARRAVARHSGARNGRRPTRTSLLGADRPGSDAPRAAAHAQVDHGGGGDAAEADGRAARARGRIGPGALLPRHPGDAAAADGGARRAVGGSPRSSSRDGSRFAGRGAGRTPQTERRTERRTGRKTERNSGPRERPTKIFSQFSPKAAPETTQGRSP
jgi:hypothetical protein